MTTGSALLEVEDLKVHYRAGARTRRREVRAVDGLSFTVSVGETLGLVGESGCGKSTTGRAILQLEEATEGTVTYQGTDVSQVRGADRLKMRRSMQAVFQDPYDSLNPRMTIRSIIGEPMVIHKLGDKSTREARVAELLDVVGLNPEVASRRPAELSGGQRQRVCIARALAVDPAFIVCDEAVSALDVSVQAQVLNLLRRLQVERDIAYLFIGHDLSVVRHVSDRVAVMYAGQLVEVADSEALYARPYHPYTAALLASSPVADPRIERDRPAPAAKGEPPSPTNWPTGCRFAARCPLATDRCRETAPELTEVEPGRRVACHYWEQASESATSPAATA